METERFKKAYNALVNAFYNGTLQAGNCRACAVGNIVASCINFELKPEHLEIATEGLDNTGWIKSVREAFHISSGDISEKVWNKQYTSIELHDITGYSPLELAKIESVFEENTYLKNYFEISYSEEELLEDQYNGLVAVVEVLLELDNIKPEEHYNKKFREHPKLIEA